MAFQILAVLLVITIEMVVSYDLSGIHVNGSRFMNNAGQEVVLKVCFKSDYSEMKGSII